jgi:hypothetical protein
MEEVMELLVLGYLAINEVIMGYVQSFIHNALWPYFGFFYDYSKECPIPMLCGGVPTTYVASLNGFAIIWIVFLMVFLLAYDYKTEKKQ